MAFFNQNQQNGFMGPNNTGGMVFDPNPITRGMNVSMPMQQYYDPRQNPPKTLTGRLVRGVEDIAPNEVPMDGSYGFFPVADGSAIYVSRWAPDGSRIEHLKFILDGAQTQNEKSFEQQVLERLDKIEKTVNRPFKKNYKKEGINNDTVAQTGDVSSDSR